MQSFSSLVPLHLLRAGAAAAVEANLCHSWPKGMAVFRFPQTETKSRSGTKH